MSVMIRKLHLLTLLGLLAVAIAPVHADDKDKDKDKDNPPPDPNFRLPPQLPGQQPRANPNAPAFIVPQTPTNTSPYLTPVQPTGGNPMASLSTPYLGGNSNLNNPNIYSPNGMNPYYNPYMPYYDPYGGALTGFANVINATAQWQVTIQQARLVQQQANQAQLSTRRALFDQIRYERMSIPTPEETRVRDLELTYRNSKNQPQLGDVWSGRALNSILANLIKQQGLGNRGPRVDLDEEMLKHINVNTGKGGNVGLLKDLQEGGTLQWPLSLQRPEFDEARKTLQKLFPEAVQEVINNRLTVQIQKDIQVALQNLDDALNKNIGDLTTNQYTEARRYLNQLNAGFRALQEPNATNYFNKNWTAKGKTVAELVKNMSAAGLQFAPATSGDEAAYRALYNSMNAYDDALTSLARP